MVATFSMEQQDDKPIPYLLGLENEIETNSEKLTPKYIRQTRQRLHSIVLRLDNFHNSKLGINKLIPDILYTIFKLAVYESRSPAKTIVRISSVCRHWRKSALGWPALWVFLDLKKHSSFLGLLVERSQNVPLSLSWTEPKRDSITYFSHSPRYFASCAKSILPRLCSLTIHAPYSCFARFHRDIENNGLLLPIQLQYLNIHLFHDRRFGDHGDRPVPPPLTHLVDNSCLQKMKLSGLDSYWLDLPHRNLTSLTYCDPINPPAIPQLLVFLFNCPSLKTLELGFRDRTDGGIETIFTTSAGPSTVNELLVLNLTTLKLGAWGSSSYDFVRQFSRCIRISPGALSQFEVTCEPTHFGELGSHHIAPPFQTLAVVPPGAFSSFSKCQFLEIVLTGNSEDCLGIFAYTSVSDRGESPRPLGIICKDLNPVDYSPILELVHAMPQISHLILRFRGCEVLKALWPNLEIRSAFPCLDTLELIQCDLEPNSLPTGLKSKRLVLLWSYVPSDVLFDMVSRMEIEILEIVTCWDSDTDEHTVDVVSVLREMGVDVVVRTEDVY